jgi:hypothetical protein
MNRPPAHPQYLMWMHFIDLRRNLNKSHGCPCFELKSSLLIGMVLTSSHGVLTGHRVENFSTFSSPPSPYLPSRRFRRRVFHSPEKRNEQICKPTLPSDGLPSGEH